MPRSPAVQKTARPARSASRPATAGGNEDAFEVHDAQPAQGLAQLVALAVVAEDGDRAYLPDPQRGQVVEDGTGRPGAGADAHHLVSVQAGLQRWLRQAGVDV